MSKPRLRYKELYLATAHELQSEVTKNVELESKLRSLQKILAKTGEQFFAAHSFDGVPEILVSELLYVCIAAFLEQQKRYTGSDAQEFLHHYSWKGIPIRVDSNE